MKSLRFIAAWIPAVLTASLLLTVLPAQWNHYRNKCPSTDVLTWDGNLRLTDVAEQYRDFGRGKIGRATLALLDAPTWPAFRAVVSLAVFSIGGGPAVHRDVAITFFYYCALFVSLLFIAARLSKSIFAGGTITFAVALLLIHSRDFNMFALSAMLETQGMFFMLWSVYFLHRLYGENEIAKESENDAAEKRSRLVTVVGLFLATQGVFHTKYPYGVILFVGIIAAEIARDPAFYINFALRLHREHFGPLRLALIGVFAAALVLSAKWGLLGDQGPNPRLAKRLVYLGFLILVIDFNIHVYRRRHDLKALLPRTMRVLYLWGAAPALFWLFIHPTRFNTTLGTQQRLPPGTDALNLSYFKLFFQQFDSRWMVVGILGAALLGVLGWCWFAYRNRNSHAKQSSGWVSYSSIAGNALCMATIAVALQWLLLEFSTPNKQPRHVYHLVPALLILAGLWVVRGIRLFTNERWVFAASGAAILFVVLGGWFTVVGQPGLLSGDYFNGRNICANLPRRFYEPARWHAAGINPRRRYVVMNFYHEALAPPPGRLLASHIDLLLRLRTRKRGDARNDSRHRWKTWREFDRLLVLSETCDHPLVRARVRQRAKATSSRLIPAAVRRHVSGKFCVREYIIRPVNSRSR